MAKFNQLAAAAAAAGKRDAKTPATAADVVTYCDNAIAFFSKLRKPLVGGKEGEGISLEGATNHEPASQLAAIWKQIEQKGTLRFSK